MRQGEIYWADLEPIKGQEQGGTRPVVIISGDTMNKHFGVSIVCPLTTNIKNFSSSVILKKNKSNGLKTDSEILSFQVRSLSQKRLVKKIGRISKEELERVMFGLFKVLKY